MVNEAKKDGKGEKSTPGRAAGEEPVQQLDEPDIGSGEQQNKDEAGNGESIRSVPDRTGSKPGAK